MSRRGSYETVIQSCIWRDRRCVVQMATKSIEFLTIQSQAHLHPQSTTPPCIDREIIKYGRRAVLIVSAVVISRQKGEIESGE